MLLYNILGFPVTTPVLEREHMYIILSTIEEHVTAMQREMERGAIVVVSADMKRVERLRERERGTIVAVSADGRGGRKVGKRIPIRRQQNKLGPLPIYSFDSLSPHTPREG